MFVCGGARYTRKGSGGGWCGGRGDEGLSGGLRGVIAEERGRTLPPGCGPGREKSLVRTDGSATWER